MKAVAHHTDERWVLLYIQRWLKAPDGRRNHRAARDGNPTRISDLAAAREPLHALAFDKWMDREYPGCPFERYADDVVIHCDTEQQAQRLWADLVERLGSLGLELHPDKTKIVYCKDTKRRDEAEHTSFDFLGYTFRGRLARRRGFFVSFSPAMSPKAKCDRQTDQGLAPQPSQRNGPRRTRPGHQRGSEAGSTTTPSTAPSCMPSQRASTNTSSDGRCRSSNDCEANPPKHGDGSTLPVSASHNSSLTGTSSPQPNAELREPYDRRLSRTVLREREGEVPSRHSPGSVAGQHRVDGVGEPAHRRHEPFPHVRPCVAVFDAHVVGVAGVYERGAFVV